MNLELDGKVAIVTGASRGLGAAAVRSLVAEGVKVVAAARSGDELEKLAAEAPGRIAGVVCDMRDAAGLTALPERALAEFGRLDILVNNAGIAPAGKFLDATAELLEDVFAVNVVAPALLARACGEIFVRQGSGKVINVASISGVRGKGSLAVYSASKGALVRLTEALAAEWSRHGVQVNTIAPGAFATEAQRAVLDDPETLRRRVAKIPARRVADPAEIGALVCYLASPLSAFVSGSTYVIDGGETAKI